MSMRSSFDYGYGFPISDLESVNGINFLLKHKKTLAKINDDYNEDTLLFLKKVIDEKIDVDDIHDTDLDRIVDFFQIPGMRTEVEYDGLWRTIAETIGIIIAEETKLSVETFFAQEDCEGTDCIMLSSRMPWGYSKHEQAFTQMEFDKAMLPYIQELGLQTTCDYLEVEYFG